MVVVLGEDLGIVMLPNLVYQVQVVLKVVVEILADPKLVLIIQEILMPHLHQLDGDMEAHLVQVLMQLVVAAVVLVVLEFQDHKVDLVFNCHLHLGIQMDSNMINIQIIHLDLVQLLDGGLQVEDQEQSIHQDQHHIVPLILEWVAVVVVVAETLLIQDIHSMVLMEWQILEVVVAVVVLSTLLVLVVVVDLVLSSLHTQPDKYLKT
tara:strand:- start:12 stop:632 length:621 start_codon:yes stop_codon:yes gene_type:complete